MPLQAIGPMIERATPGALPSGISKAGASIRFRGSSTPPRRSRSPVIIGFNGAFLCGDRRADERLVLMRPWAGPPPNRQPSLAA